MVCTLGTGLGTAWFRDGELMPHMDLAHMAVHAKDDFDVYLGDKTFKKIGRKDWCKRVEKTTLANDDMIELGEVRFRFLVNNPPS